MRPLALVHDRDITLLKELRLQGLDVPASCILEHIKERQFLKAHVSISSKALRPFAISCSNPASRFRITLGGSYSTAS